MKPSKREKYLEQNKKEEERNNETKTNKQNDNNKKGKGRNYAAKHSTTIKKSLLARVSQ